MAVLDGEQDIDIIKKIDFYLKDSYDGHMSIDKLVERAYQVQCLRAGSQQGAQGAPATQTGRPDTSGY